MKRIFNETDINRPNIPIDAEVKIAKITVLIKKLVIDILSCSLALFNACNELNNGASK